MSADDLMAQKQEWWSMDTVQRATYVDDLIGRIKELEAENERLREALIRHGRHDADCGYLYKVDQCHCGLADALREVTP